MTGSRLTRAWTAAAVVLAATTALGASECATERSVEGGEADQVFTASAADLAPVEGEAIPVFPGAEGFGTRTRAGRGGRVVTVTSLDDDGPGTLRAALADDAPKTIVFGVGGTIVLKSHLFISHPYVTVAGQTAPGDGITIRDFGLIIGTHDILVQSIRVRPGNTGAVRPEHNDAIQLLGPEGQLTGAKNVVVDHVSVSWGEDELISTWFGPSDITVSWSLIAEGLNRSRHEKGTHSSGLIIANRTNRVSVHHNLLAHNDFRNPLVMSGGVHDVVNNVIYDWGVLATELSDDVPMAVNLVGNYYRPGPSTKTEYPILISPTNRGITPKFYAAGNVRDGAAEPADGWSLVQYGWKDRGAPDRYRATERLALPPITTEPAAAVLMRVLDGVGAIGPRRDAIDARVVADVRRRTGKIIDSPEEVGGYLSTPLTRGPVDTDGDGLPDEWERREQLDPRNAADGNQDRDGDGYTNLEAYLHALMRGR